MARSHKPRTSYLHTASFVPYTGMTLCDVLDQAAENFQNKEAFVFASELGTKRVTFEELRRDVIKMAAGLLHLGLKPGDRVGIWCENRYEWIVTQYATAYIKMTCVRFQVGYNAKYMKYLINNTRVTTMVIGSGDQVTVLREISPTVIGGSPHTLPTLRRLIHLGEEVKAGMFRFGDVLMLGNEDDFQRATKIRQLVQQDDEMTILFTSGSTGIPKAVVMLHRCVMENVYTVGRFYSSASSEEVCYMSGSPFSHTAGQMSTMIGIIWGFKVIVPSITANEFVMADLIQKEKVTVAFMMFQHLFNFISSSHIQHYDFNSLKLYVSGNTAPKEALDKVRELITPHLFNILGSTETGGITHNFNPEKYDSVGYPLDHQEVKIINQNGEIVPLNTTGELCIRSPYLFLRYEGDEVKTKEVIDNSGWYHTGDLCLMEEDACLHVMGRQKDIIIKGGQNIYPTKIERILVGHPNVKLAQVVSVPDKRMVEEICACVCLEGGTDTTAEDIMQYVRPIMVEFHVPKYVLVFDSFPSAPTGKINRTELAKDACKRLQLDK
ncbi:medium-chain acyl-CoA ligase ACSF2, mitochondrial-like [Glandiceps talaboti]